MTVVFYGWQQTQSASEDTRSGGSVVGRVVTTTVTRQPDNLILSEQKDTYTAAPLGGGFSGKGLQLSKSDTKTCLWQDSVYGPSGPVNQPKQNSESVRSFAWANDPASIAVPPTQIWTEVSKVETGFAYDGITGQVAAQTTVKFVRASVPSSPSTFQLVPQSMTVKRTAQQGTNWVAVTTDNLTWNSQSGTWVTDAGNSGDVGIGGGKKPGAVQSGGGGPFNNPPAIIPTKALNSLIAQSGPTA